MMAKGYFCAYHSYLAAMEQLNDEERGRLFTALLEYSQSGRVQPLTGNERFVFPAMRDQIDRDDKKYTDKCERNRRNAAQRYTAGEQSTNACDRMRTYANAYERIRKPANIYDRMQSHANAAKEKEKEKENIEGVIGGETETADKPPARRINLPRFVKPTIDEVDAYFAQQGNVQQSQRFFDYYEANGWKVGKNSMRDWKAAARNWLRNQSQYDKAARGAAAPEIQDNQISRVIQMIEENKI